MEPVEPADQRVGTDYGLRYKTPADQRRVLVDNAANVRGRWGAAGLLGMSRVTTTSIIDM
jgi:hypothetical protein